MNKPSTKAAPASSARAAALPLFPHKDWPHWPQVVTAALFVLVLLVFGRSANYGFLNFDDNQYIQDIPEVRAGLSAKSIWWAWTNSHVGQWHPLTSMSFMFDAQVSGLKAGWFHFHNVLLHGGAASLCFLALRKLTGSTWRSALTAAIFAIHPLRAESVAWVTERKDVLSGVFLMATLWAYGWYVQKPACSKRYGLLIALFVLGLLAKPMLVTLPFAFLLLDVWPLRRLSWDNLSTLEDWKTLAVKGWPLLREKLPLMGFAFASAIGAVFAVGEPHRPIGILPLIPRLMYIPVSYATYLWQFIFPLHLSAHYPFTVNGPAPWKVAVALGILVTGTVISWVWRKKHPYVGVGWLWFLGSLLPVIGLVPGGIQILADRYTYLPQLGLAASVAWLLGAWVQDASEQIRKVAVAGAALLILTLSVMAGIQCTTWKDDETLWAHALSVTKNNDYAHEKYASALQVKNQRDEAEYHFREALKLNGHLVGSLNNLSVLLRTKGEFEEAIALQRRAVEEHPRWGLMHRNLGSALAQSRDFAGAVASYKKAFELEPSDIESCFNVGLILNEIAKSEEEIDEAARYFQKTLQMQPLFPEGHFQLANIAYRKNRPQEALDGYQRTLQLYPNHARALNNIGSLLGASGNTTQAVEFYLKAVTADPNYADAFRNLAGAYMMMGRPVEAIDAWRNCLARNPQDVNALFSLAWILSTHPNPDIRRKFEARDAARQGVELTGGREPAMLDALATALAQMGNFEEAVQTAQRALNAFPEGQRPPLYAAIQSRLELFRKQEVYIEQPPAPGSSAAAAPASTPAPGPTPAASATAPAPAPVPAAAPAPEPAVSEAQ